MNEERGAQVRVPPPLVFVGGLLLGMAIGRVVPLAPLLGRTMRVALAYALVGLGLLLILWAIGLFRKTDQSPIPWTPTPSLVFNGPYQFTRNPMYLGMTLLVGGIGLWLDNLWVVIFTFVALAIVHATAVLPEEEYLGEKFGESYRTYKSTVRRYL